MNDGLHLNSKSILCSMSHSPFTDIKTLMADPAMKSARLLTEIKSNYSHTSSTKLGFKSPAVVFFSVGTAGARDPTTNH